MATLLRIDGSQEARRPASGKKWTLRELQDAVGGDIEVMPGIGKPHVVLNESGFLLQLPVNERATALVRERMAQRLGCAVADLPFKVGSELTYLPILVGDVLVLDIGEGL